MYNIYIYIYVYVLFDVAASVAHFGPSNLPACFLKAFHFFFGSFSLPSFVVIRAFARLRSSDSWQAKLRRQLSSGVTKRRAIRKGDLSKRVLYKLRARVVGRGVGGAPPEKRPPVDFSSK